MDSRPVPLALAGDVTDPSTAGVTLVVQPNGWVRAYDGWDQRRLAV